MPDADVSAANSRIIAGDRGRIDERAEVVEVGLEVTAVRQHLGDGLGEQRRWVGVGRVAADHQCGVVIVGTSAQRPDPWLPANVAASCSGVQASSTGPSGSAGSTGRNPPWT